jgi:hypothetical protein
MDIFTCDVQNAGDWPKSSIACSASNACNAFVFLWTVWFYDSAQCSVWRVWRGIGLKIAAVHPPERREGTPLRVFLFLECTGFERCLFSLNFTNLTINAGQPARRSEAPRRKSGASRKILENVSLRV